MLSKYFFTVLFKISGLLIKNLNRKLNELNWFGSFKLWKLNLYDLRWWWTIIDDNSYILILIFKIIVVPVSELNRFLMISLMNFMLVYSFQLEFLNIFIDDSSDYLLYQTIVWFLRNNFWRIDPCLNKTHCHFCSIARNSSLLLWNFFVR